MALALALSAPASALEWNAGIGGDARWFDWREEAGGQQLLREIGPLFAPVVSFELQQGPFYAGVESAWGGGLARYDGRLQTGAGYEADAWEEIVDTEWRLGWRNALGGAHLGYMQRDWRRYIEGSGNVSSAEERYRWRLVTLGGEVVLQNAPQWRLALTVGRPAESYQKVYTSFYDDFTLEPGDGVYWRISMPYRQPRALGGVWVIEPYYQQQDMDASDPRLLRIGGVSQNLLAYQPASVRRELGITLRLQFGSADTPSGPVGTQPQSAPGQQPL
jgi:hypothetical protein